VTEQQWFLSGALVFALGLDLFSNAGIVGLLNINHARLISMPETDKTLFKRVLWLTEPLNTHQAHASIQLASGVLRFLTGGLVLMLFQSWVFSNSSPWFFDVKIAGLLILVGLSLACLEWIATQSALRNPETWTIRCAPLIRIWMLIFYPLVILERFLFSGPVATTSGSMTEDELKSLVDVGQQNGVLEQEERKMIYSIFKLADTLAREIMIPRIDITALDVQTPYDQAVDNLLKSGYSRVPVYKETIDNVLGVLYTKDLLRVWRQNDQLKSLRDLLRPAYFIPEAKKVDQLLAEMQAQRVHMAVVVDEYGGVAGLVTLEDIVEEIVGEIQDEFDQAEELPYEEIGEGEYLFQGKIGLDDFNEIMDSHLPSDEAETLGGFIYNQVGRVPANGEIIHVGNLLLTVTQVSGRRIRKVRAQWTPVTPESQEEKTNVD
jgi:putative hemolysin